MLAQQVVVVVEVHYLARKHHPQNHLQKENRSAVVVGVHSLPNLRCLYYYFDWEFAVVRVLAKSDKTTVMCYSVFAYQHPRRDKNLVLVAYFFFSDWDTHQKKRIMVG